jgi:hypothetical protein
MAKKPTVTTVASGYYGRQALNDNFEALRDAFDNTLSRDGSTPNAMGADLDMNSNDILNASEIDATSLRLGGVLVSPSAVSIQSSVAASNVFTGDGSTTVYTLTYEPFIKDNTQVYIDGVYQNKVGYNTSGTTLTFTEAPPLNSQIEVMIATTLTDVGTAAAAAVTYNQGGVGAVNTTVQAKLQETVSVKDFGAVGDGVTDDTAAIQAAIDAAPFGGSVYFPSGKYIISAAITVNKPMTIFGPNAGSIQNNSGSYIQQTTTSENAFTLVARTQNYAFGQYGIIGVTFESLAIYGNSSGTKSATGIGVDTTVNSGDFHIRECVFRDVNVKWFEKAYDLEGIAYLNDWFNGSITQCTKGVVITKGSASDSGGQTRFFGLTAVLNTDACVELNLDTATGDFAFFGCTLSESGFGIKCEEEALLGVYGCQFESNQSSGVGAGIYIEISQTNPNTEAPKVINNCKFINNDADIWVDKTTSAFSGGGFHWPMTIDGCVLQSTNALKVTVPAGHVGIDSPAFVLGPSNGGASTGRIGDSQISANFLGSDLREYPFNDIKSVSIAGQQISYNGSGGSVIIAAIAVPDGSTLNLTKASRYSYDTTTGARGNADLKAIDGSGTTLIDLFGNGDDGSGTWTNSTGSSVNARVRVNDGGSGDPFFISSRLYVTS